MKTMNKVELIGYLGKGPDIREYSNGIARATMRLATDSYHQPRSGAPIKRTEWHTVILWGKDPIVRFCQFLMKGSHVLVIGQLRHDMYVDKTGQTRYVTEIKANSLVDLDR